MLVRPRLVQLPIRLAGFGAVERDVGFLEQVVDVLRMVREERDAHRRLDRHRHAVHDERLLDRLPHTVHDVDRTVGPAHVRKQDPELVGAQPRDRVTRAQSTAQPRFDLTKELVPVPVPERVVDLLEAVDVDHQSSDAIAAPGGSEQRLPATVEVKRAIRQPGQTIVEGEVLRLRCVTPHAFGRTRNDRKERCPEEPDARQQEQGERAKVVSDRRRDRRVRHVQLEDSAHATVRGAQRDVHLEQSPEAMVLDVLGLLEVRDVRDDVTLGGFGEVLSGRKGAADQTALVGEDDPAVEVPQLDPHDARGVKVARRRAELPLHTWRERRSEVRARDDRLDRRASHQSCRVTRTVQRTRADLTFQEVEQPEAERRERDEADERERREQARARTPGEGGEPL